MAQIVNVKHLLQMLSLCFLVSVQALHPVKNKLQALTYLTQFGYIQDLSTREVDLVSDDYVTEAISEFQRFAGLKNTGILDNDTITMMNLPRCGVKDKIGRESDARWKRYALQGSQWNVNNLTYRITNYTITGLTESQIDEEIARAFQVWSDYTNLRFIPITSDQPLIEIRFEIGEHGCDKPFDGTGGTLAHAYFPIYGGDAHFDDEEHWTIRSYSGTNLFQVAAHEFGHSLGLSHSDDLYALMNPFYHGYDAKFKLHEDDIKAIQALYGVRTTDNEPFPPSPSPPPDIPENDPEKELCVDSTIDAIFSEGKRTYVFKGNYYWEVGNKGLINGYPRSITKDWPGLPTNIDAAFTYANEKTYFFKGSQYWRFNGRRKDDGYPKSIKEGFGNIPDNVSAAFMWSKNGKVYFFKGSKYWKYDQSKNPTVSSDYPKPVSSWTGIPSNINAAFQYTNGFTYFFKGTQYWRFNDRRFEVDEANPSFPRSTAVWWFHCKPMFSNSKAMSSTKIMLQSSSENLSVYSSDDNVKVKSQHDLSVKGTTFYHKITSVAIELLSLFVDNL